MLLTAKNLIIGDGKTNLRNGAILIGENGKIKEVGLLSQLQAKYSNEAITDFQDASILPGLTDMHVHFGYYYSQPDSYNYDNYMLAYYAQEQGKKALELGITTVRDLSSPSGLMKQLRVACEKGYCQGPRIIHTDTGMCMTGGHGHDDGIVEVDEPWNIRKEVRKQLRDGADWIKVLTSNRTSVPEYTQEELDAAVDETHRLGYKCAVHAGLQPALQMSIDAGFDTIEHGTFLTYEQVKQMVANNQAWIPTMTAYTVLYEFCKEKIEAGVDKGDRIAAKAIQDMTFFEPAYNAYKDNFKKFYDTGVVVCTGSDMVLYEAPPLPINREMELMVEYGITPLQAIQTATENPAKVLGMQDIFGSLKEGLMADILVVKGNVEEDIKAINAVIEVYQSGKSVYKK
ncbi:imidazolonepropionase-like amidohydrolase [Lachnospiraceae bacterium PF1-21]|uniref:Amidohydrolase family protein n=1 Tax=Ohessyouella blattaphilus TaxID=2949333 RepID=A0ABT1EL36_9FIRM|nr:amidohydrolase family protein [Ohessyouella blattaphilus]MCP1111413.1 amidohydrolase family protein [Ohessyouella blattaphilus]MCR8564807.1 amidohydrolase family protein [Ohessyouella blattaphilus]MDL2249962.1 amidohydrolase family protein [Lachnospiraceae bacterium OttesenSCG-928-J05]